MLDRRVGDKREYKMPPRRLQPKGVLPYKSDEGARRKISRTPLKVTRILFYGLFPNSFPPLKGTKSAPEGTNSTTTNNITGTANFKSHFP